MKTLVIAEKPSVGRDIARVLKCSRSGNGCLEGDKYIVTWALGHLVTLADPEDYDKKYKEWKMEDLPMMPETFRLEVIKQTGKQYQAVKSQIHRKDVGDIVIANLLFILCCIPVITIGPSLTALYHCMMRTVKGNNNGTTKTFFRAFKENFKQSLIIWLLILAAGTMLILNIRFLLHAEGSAAHMLFYLSVGVLTLLIIFTLYIFPVIATFANTLGALCRNAFLLAFMHFPTTIAIAVITIFPLYMTYLDAKLQPLYACCWFFFGFGLVAFINSMLLYRFFKKLLPPEEDISLL